MAYEKAKAISTDDWVQIPDWNQRGISSHYAKLVNFDAASEYADSQQQDLQQLGYGRFSMTNIVPGGSYEFGSGSLSAPGIRWAADTNTGWYLIGDANPGAAVNGTLAYDWNATRLKLAADYQLFMGTSSNLSPSGTDIVAIQGTSNAALRWTMKNTSSGASAESTLSMYNDTTGGRFCSIGLKSSGYTTAGDPRAANEAFVDAGSISGATSTNLWILTRDGGGIIKFGTNDSEVARFLSGGQLCLNATALSGSEQLRVNGAVYVDGATHLVGTATIDDFPKVLAGSTTRTISGGAAQVYLANTSQCQLYFDVTNQASNAKLWDINPFGTTMQFRCINDANSSANVYFSVTRSGFVPTAVIINEDGNSCDFRVEGDTAANLFLTTGSTDRISSTVSDTATTPIYDFLQASTGDSGTRWTLSGGASFMAGIDNSDSDSWKLSYGSAGNAALGTNDYITVLTGGNVGIGTTGPDRKLDILDASNPQLRLTYTDGSVYTDFTTDSSGYLLVEPSGGRIRLSAANGTHTILQFESAGAPRWYFYRPASSNDLKLESNSVADIMYWVNTTGNVGINTTSPRRKLDVLDTAAAQMRLTYTDNSVYGEMAVGSDGKLTYTAAGTLPGIAFGGNYRFSHGTSALATTATEGFLHIQSCAGAPTGVPASIPTGQIPMVWDSTNLQLYVYTGGAWKKSAVFT